MSNINEEDTLGSRSEKSAKEQVMRKLVTQAILELEVEPMDDDTKQRFRHFKTLATLNFYPSETKDPSLQLDTDFYTTHVVPRICRILERESKPLKTMKIINNDELIAKSHSICKSLDDLAKKHHSLQEEISTCQKMLHEVLHDNQWKLGHEIAQAEVDYAVLTAEIYEKKFARIANSIIDIYKEYRYDEAIRCLNSVMDRQEKELKEEVQRRKEKHEIYLKARKVEPKIDGLLEKYQSLIKQIKTLEEMDVATDS